jgi:hypothetical protein
MLFGNQLWNFNNQLIYTFMKNAILFFLLFHFTFLCLAQNDKYPKCNYQYFERTKIVSTSICWNESNTWGETVAYKKDGTQIYRKQLRKVGGHASVRYEYHANGAVKKIEFSDAPDGGIQWSREKISFDEQGNMTDNDIESNEQLTHITRPSFIAPEKKQSTPIITPKENQGKPYFANYIIVKNYTNTTVTVVALPENDNEKPTTTLFLPNETKQLLYYGNGNDVLDPFDRYAFLVSKKIKSKGKKPRIKFDRKEVTANAANYYYTIR